MEAITELSLERAQPLASRLAMAQGVFDIVTGVWPIVNPSSFEASTGFKCEGWLVKTMGALVTVVGSTLLLGGWRRRISPELMLLAAGSAASFAVADLRNLPRRGSSVYLLDGLGEVLCIAGWCAVAARAWKRQEARLATPQYTSPEDAAGFPT
jgi:hypothetical protein